VPSGSTGRLPPVAALRAGRILARMRARIDRMLDEVEECARLASLEGESENVPELGFDLEVPTKGDSE